MLKFYFYRLLENEWGIHGFSNGFEISLYWVNFIVTWEEE